MSKRNGASLADNCWRAKHLKVGHALDANKDSKSSVVFELENSETNQPDHGSLGGNRNLDITVSMFHVLPTSDLPLPPPARYVRQQR
jgi:hypothetical protein